MCVCQIAHLQATIEALKSSKEEQGKKIETLAQKLKEVLVLVFFFFSFLFFDIWLIDLIVFLCVCGAFCEIFILLSYYCLVNTMKTIFIFL